MRPIPQTSRPVRHLTALTLVVTLSAGLLSGVFATGASAQSSGPDTETRRIYQTMLGRSTAANLGDFKTRTDGDCHWGTEANGFIIADSAEAHSRWRNPRAFSTALHQALLNRQGSSADVQLYTNYITARANDDGYRRAIMQMQASREYKDRVAAICAGHKSTNGNVLYASDAVHAAIGINDAGMDLVVACGVGKAISIIGGLAAGRLIEVNLKIKAAEWAISHYVKPNGSCVPAYQVLNAADRIVTAADLQEVPSTHGDNAVYVSLDQSSRFKVSPPGKWCKVTIGSAWPTQSRTMTTVEFRCT